MVVISTLRSGHLPLIDLMGQRSQREPLIGICLGVVLIQLLLTKWSPYRHHAPLRVEAVMNQDRFLRPLEGVCLQIDSVRSDW
ncbi:hypothetical protein BS17DRAFT_791344 [Gyrodon lividus]|nr:hypothetical protein BS17DRAFT_791561 [Gyrodon lividus]KAF9218475.1 hypothetical protein BS17DRAFT_791344 [Gyrodon lividus]